MYTFNFIIKYATFIRLCKFKILAGSTCQIPTTRHTTVATWIGVYIASGKVVWVWLDVELNRWNSGGLEYSNTGLLAIIQTTAKVPAKHKHINNHKYSVYSWNTFWFHFSYFNNDSRLINYFQLRLRVPSNPGIPNHGISTI